ncbi:MAG: endo-1,4-beta-xylanase [Halanaerobiales bacterium]
MNNEIKSLAKSYEKYFKIGTCISNYSIENHQKLLKKHFNSFTCENAMKPENMQPKPGIYNFKKADDLIDEIKGENNKIRGHTLVWHNQIPEWFFLDVKENYVSKKTLLERMKIHIKNVVSHYKDRVYCWDVVNEAIEDEDEDRIYRKNRWYKICGKEYIEEAFKYTRKVDPEAKLLYNDYNAVESKKRDKIYKLLQDMIERKIPVDGVGIQGHWNIYSPSPDKIKKAIEKYASLGLDIEITELDLSVYGEDDKRNDLKKPTPEMRKKQEQRYIDIFRIFREYSKHISNVTFWGTADDHTWKDNFPVKGRKDWPLLFDEDHNPKPALLEIINEA